MHTDSKENNRLWYLLARKTANELTTSENDELVKLMQLHPETLYVQEIMSQQWYDSYKRFDIADIDEAFKRHKLRLQNTTSEDFVPAFPIATKEKPSNRGIAMFLRYVSAVAACAILMFIFFKWSDKKEPEQHAEALQELATQYGTRSQLILPDGTKVWLNAGSKLNYPKQFARTQREVMLEGEAFFDVTENRTQPFLVHTKAFTVKVLGTAFNIRAYADEDSAATSLIRGSVEVELKGGPNNKVLLRPNEKLTVPVVIPVTIAAADADAAGTPEEPVNTEVKKSFIATDKANTVVETAWVNNKLAFKNMSFEQIALVLEKWFAVEIKFQTDSKRKLKLSGTFEGESLEEILSAFKETGRSSFMFKKDENGIIIIH